MDGRTNSGQTDVFLSRFDPQGNRVFTVLIGTPGNELDPRVAVDAAGHVYVAGTTDGILDNGAASPGNGDLFVAKIDPATGETLWIRQIGGEDGAGSRSVESDPSLAVDPAGNVYAACSTTGVLDNAIKTGDGAADGVTTDIALVKLDPPRNRLWTRQHGSAGNDAAGGIAISPSGDILVGGDTDGVLEAGTSSPGAGTSSDVFAARFLPDGTLDWIRQRGSALTETVFGVAVDNAGNAYVTGFTDGGLDNNANLGVGTLDFFVVKFDSLGGWLYTRQLGTSADDIGFAAAADGAGNVYIAGMTTGDFGGNGNSGLLDAFLAKLDPAGTVLYARQFGSAFEESAFGLGLAPGIVYITGFTNGTLDALPNPDPSNATPDGFIVKFGTDGTRL
jgi:hypothetical protein